MLFLNHPDCIASVPLTTTLTTRVATNCDAQLSSQTAHNGQYVSSLNNIHAKSTRMGKHHAKKTAPQHASEPIRHFI